MFLNIRLDTREKELQTKITEMISTNPTFKDIQMTVECLPLGDIIIMHPTLKDVEALMIERKCVNDLLSSIKDGRYEEQSYRLNGNAVHNHNIMYLIEGDVRKGSLKSMSQMLYSAMFSLNYYKGFSVMRTFNLEETALFLCNSVVKLMNGEKKGRKAFYNGSNNALNNALKDGLKDISNNSLNNENIFNNGLQELVNTSLTDLSNNLLKDKDKDKDKDKEYIGLVKSVKKENITQQNIDEIMLCQIPGISNVTAIALIKHFGTLIQLIHAFQENPECWREVSYVTEKNQCRKIPKTIGTNICKYLLKKDL
jgi:ERCC4-type nuclease